MSSTHLSDEAVAAFADGVLRGNARSRAARHVDTCVECRQAVRAQREAVLALRQAPAPALPAGLFERLRGLPAVSPANPDAQPAEPPAAASGLFAPMAAFVPADTSRPLSSDEADDDAGARHGVWGLAALFTARARRRS